MSKIERTIYGIEPCVINVEDICKKIDNGKKAINLTVYRGDKRTPDVITKEGFVPRFHLSQQLLLNLCSNLEVDQQFGIDFAYWCKNPNSRNIAIDFYPFVATGINDPHYTYNEYRIDLETVYQYDFGIGIYKKAIIFDKERLENSTIIGIQIDKEEIVFGTDIPSCFITPIKKVS